METPSLSVLGIVGAERSRCTPLLNALAEQTILDELEVILVDVAAQDVPDIVPPSGLNIQVLRRPSLDPRLESFRDAASWPPDI